MMMMMMMTVQKRKSQTLGTVGTTVWKDCWI